MSSKRAGLPSLNSSSGSKKGDALQPVKVQRYRAGQAPEGYVDPALESSSDEDEQAEGGRRRNDAVSSRKINVSIGDQESERRAAYQVINVERMTQERLREKAEQRQGGKGQQAVPVPTGGDRRLARLQAVQTEDRRSRGDARSRRRGDSDEEQEDEEEDEEEEDEEEATLRRRKAARARALREEAEGEEELWGQGEEEDEEEEEHKRSRRRHDEESEGSSEETSSGSEEESSEDEMAPRRKLLKPVFVPKSQRITIDESLRAEAAAELAEKARQEEIEARKKESHQMLKDYVSKQAAVEEVPDIDNHADIDDTDGLDEEAEFEQWKLRELKRIKRDREELEAREAEKAETERRRELTEEERVKEDMAYLAKKAKAEQALKASGSVEKYHHKGAFFMDTDEAILKRSTNEATPDAVKDVKALPKIMQVRNFGRAGQTKYTTLKDQDTSRPSGWSDPAMQHMQQRHRMAGFRGDDFKIAAKLGGGVGGRGGFGGRGGRGGGRGGGGFGRENANHTQLGDRDTPRDRDGDRDQGRERYRDRDSDRSGDRDRDRGSKNSDRGSYHDRDADRSRRDSRDRGSSSRSGGRDYDRDRDRDRRSSGHSKEYRDRDRTDDSESSKRRRY
ncbi:Microfibrillar-associated protein 1 [Gryganskiella cystojenkinii]|nr:Microfibrillar-associated protein 1 [Gryganskiella cystojenkinii]